MNQEIRAIQTAMAKDALEFFGDDDIEMLKVVVRVALEVSDDLYALARGDTGSRRGFHHQMSPSA